MLLSKSPWPGGGKCPPLWPTSGALPMLASRPLHVLTALPIFHIGGLLAQKSRSVLCRRGASQHRERYRCWPEGGALAPPLAKAICLTARAKSLMWFFFFSLFEDSRERYRMFSPKAKFVIMILKQSGALPNVFAKSNF